MRQNRSTGGLPSYSALCISHLSCPIRPAEGPPSRCQLRPGNRQSARRDSSRPCPQMQTPAAQGLLQPYHARGDAGSLSVPGMTGGKRGREISMMASLPFVVRQSAEGFSCATASAARQRVRALACIVTHVYLAPCPTSCSPPAAGTGERGLSERRRKRRDRCMAHTQKARGGLSTANPRGVGERQARTDQTSLCATSMPSGYRIYGIRGRRRRWQKSLESNGQQISSCDDGNGARSRAFSR
jgi:hypothetical protein